MANLIVLLDPDASRRDRVMTRIRSELPFLDGLRSSHVAAGDFAAAWAAPAGSPIDSSSGATAVAFVFGDAIGAAGSKRLAAADLLASVGAEPGGSRDAAVAGRGARDDGGARIPVFDGFHALVRYDVARGLWLSADVLGLFPIYYAFREDALIAGTSPELFRLHPAFPPEFCEDGAIGLLLTHGIVGGRTLLRGVRRLSPGHALYRKPSGEYGESRQYALPSGSPGGRTSFEDHLARLDEAYSNALRRQVADSSRVGLLLSGGRDSRLLAGYLSRMGVAMQALTLGRAGDDDARCAARVARALGMTQERVDLPETLYGGWAATQAKWEHLGAGFSNIHTWGAIGAMRRLPTHCVNGYLREIREVPLGDARFEHLFDGSHSHGIPPALLRALLRPAWRDLVDACLEELEAAWTSMAASPEDRQWRFLMEYGWRAHPGGVLWRFTFGSWPVVPILDRGLLEVMVTTPAATFGDRRSQDELIRRRFPALARLPLDRNNLDTEPLAPSAMRHLANPAIVAVRRMAEGLSRDRNRDRRYYHRVFDIDGRGWRDVRRRAEPQREMMTRLFEPTELSKLVPPPDTAMRLTHAVRDGFGRKLILGLMLWAADHPI